MKGVDWLSEEEYNIRKEESMAVKKLRKLKDQLDKLREKEDDLANQIDETIDELEDPDEE